MGGYLTFSPLDPVHHQERTVADYTMAQVVENYAVRALIAVGTTPFAL